MVHDDDQDVIERSVGGHGAEKSCADRIFVIQVEPGHGEVGEPALGVRGCHVDHVEQPGRGSRLRRVDELVGLPVLVGERGPQRLVPRDDVVDRGGQRGGVDVGAEPHRPRDVVGRRGRVQPVDEPQTTLAERQRNPVRTRLREELRPARGGVVGHRCRDPDDVAEALALEDIGELDVEARDGTQSRGQPSRGERVRTEREDVVLQPDRLDVEQFFDDRDHFAFPRGGGRDVGDPFIAREHRLGQRLPVQFAVGGQGQRVDQHDDVGHHVPGDMGADLLADGRFV